MASVKEDLKASAGKVVAPSATAPRLMEPEGGPPRPLNLKDPDGVAMEKPNSAKRWAEPTSALVRRARGGGGK